MKLFFDIETGPQPDEQLMKVCPEFTAPANYKDPEKIAAYIGEAREAWKQKAALDALTGEILLFTFLRDTKEPIVIDAPERSIIKTALNIIVEQLRAASPICGFNIKGFDLPFIVRRAWVHGIEVPAGLLSYWKGRCSWNENVIDLFEIWQLGCRSHEGCSLKNISTRLLGETKDDCGKNFAQILKDDPARAVEYAKQDVRLLVKLSKRMQI